MATDYELLDIPNTRSTLDGTETWYAITPDGTDYQVPGSALDARFVQPEDLATVATTGDYGDLLSLPTLGDLAAENWPASDSQEYVAKNGAWAVVTPSGAALTIQEVDGTPSVANVDTIVVSNGTLTDDGAGQVTLTIGGGAVDSVFSRTGVVVAQSGDYTAAQVTNAAAVNAANTFTADQTFDEDIFQATGKSIGIGTITPQTFLHFQAAGAGTHELRVAGPGGTIARVGLWESTANDPVDGGYLQFNGVVNYLEIGTRDSSITDRPAIRISKGSAFYVAIGADPASTPGINSVVIGRDSRATHARAIVIGTGASGNVASPANETISLGINGTRQQVITSTGVGFGVDVPAAKVHVDQPSTTAGIPVLALDQADVDEDFISFIGTSSAATTDRSLIKPSDFPTPGAVVAWLKCKIQDDRVGGIGTIDAWIPAYATPTV